jgi:hypothetical protein
MQARKLLVIRFNYKLCNNMKLHYVVNISYGALQRRVNGNAFLKFGGLDALFSQSFQPLKFILKLETVKLILPVYN